MHPDRAARRAMNPNLTQTARALGQMASNPTPTPTQEPAPAEHHGPAQPSAPAPSQPSAQAPAPAENHGPTPAPAPAPSQPSAQEPSAQETAPAENHGLTPAPAPAPAPAPVPAPAPAPLQQFNAVHTPTRSQPSAPVSAQAPPLALDPNHDETILTNAAHTTSVAVVVQTTTTEGTCNTDDPDLPEMAQSDDEDDEDDAIALQELIARTVREHRATKKRTRANPTTATPTTSISRARLLDNEPKTSTTTIEPTGEGTNEVPSMHAS